MWSEWPAYATLMRIASLVEILLNVFILQQFAVTTAVCSLYYNCRELFYTVRCNSSRFDVSFVVAICRCVFSGDRRRWASDAHQTRHVCSGIAHSACSGF